MKKILVSVFVPTIEESYDIKIPINLQTRDVINLLQDTIKDLSGDSYVINKNAQLYEKNTGKLINLNNVVKYSGLQNGMSVLLF